MNNKEVIELLFKFGVLDFTKYYEGTDSLIFTDGSVEVTVEHHIIEIKDILNTNNEQCYAIYNCKTDEFKIRYNMYYDYTEPDDEDGYESPDEISVSLRSKLYSTEEKYFQASLLEEQIFTYEQNKEVLNFLLNCAEHFSEPLRKFLEKYSAESSS